MNFKSLIMVLAIGSMLFGFNEVYGIELKHAQVILRERTIPIARVTVPVSSKDFGNYDLFTGGPPEKITDFKNKYPSTKFLRYWSAITTPVKRPSTSVYFHFDHELIKKDHPEWFILTPKDGLIEVTVNIEKVGVRHILDIGNPDFRFWAAQQIPEQLTPGHAGVFLDNVIPTVDNKFFSASIPYSQEQWETHWLKYLSGIRNKLKQRGNILIVNLGIHFYDKKFAPFLLKLTDVVDGIVDEFFMTKGGKVFLTGKEWESSLENHRLLGRSGIIDVMTGAAMDDSSQMMYSYASALLAMGPNSYYALNTTPQWFDIWNISIGKPAEDSTRLDNGIWERAFTNGIAVVNPTQESLIFHTDRRIKDIVTNEVFDKNYDLLIAPTSGYVFKFFP